MLTETTLNQLLFHYPAIHQLPADLQHMVCQTAVTIQLPPHHILFNEGDACLNFVMPLSGSVRVVKPERSGRELLLYRIRPGDSCILTVSCLLGNQKYNARGIVDRPVTAVSLTTHLQRLDTARQLLLDVYANLTLADFRRARLLPQYHVTPEWVLYHLTQHETEHRGQIQEICAYFDATHFSQTDLP
ncbi:MAG: cyclic nucleotide-binding domain-containing protein [Anaerolineales bacterium]|nr:cyclic nucleotide-binding domain-containing protein [Anaerolineales bacterium]